MQKINKSVVGVLIAIFAVVGLSSVYFAYDGAKENIVAEQAEVASVTVTLGIVGGNLDTSFAVTLAKDSSAYDVLLQGAQVENIEVTTEDFNGSPFVSALGGVAGSASSYWAFYVNGESSDVGMGDYVIQEADKIEMRYTTF